MPARILLACLGSYGDLFPYLALAGRLKDLGHTPVLATSAYYRDMVEAEGIAFYAVRPDIDPSNRELVARVMDPIRGAEALIRDLVVPSVRDAFADLTEAARGADLVVTHPITFAAPLVAESLRLPWISTVLAPTSMFSAYDFPLLPPYPSITRVARAAPWSARAFLGVAKRITASWTAPVRTLRAALGVPDTGDPLYDGQFSPRGTLALFSPIFGPPQRDWPANTTATGFVFRHDPAELPDDVVRFLETGDAPIVFTLGSSAVGAAGTFYDESVNAVKALGCRAILLVGTDSRNRAAHGLPPGVIAVEYAPHGALFPRAAAIVHHGGVGTTAEALRSGRPMLVAPHAHDQPDNAFRARKLGVARALDARHYTARRAARELGVLLGDSRYRQRAEGVARQLAAENGVETACREILRHASVQ